MSLYVLDAHGHAPSHYRMFAEAGSSAEAVALLVNARTLRWFRTADQAADAVRRLDPITAAALLKGPGLISDWQLRTCLEQPIEPAPDQECLEGALECAMVDD